jgi:hypothetical protein
MIAPAFPFFRPAALPFSSKFLHINSFSSTTKLQEGLDNGKKN